MTQPVPSTLGDRGGFNSEPNGEKPLGDISGFKRYWRYDVQSGLVVFLIALPLCLGISLASGFPPLAGVFTAIVGALVSPLISNSEMTIKGPAAGLIVIVLGCVEAFGGDGMLDGWSSADQAAYQATLAVGLTAAILQVVFGFFRAGIIGEFFPIAAVHGMLAAIGVIIVSKQIPVALGVHVKGSPLELLSRIPEFVVQCNPAIALIGCISVATMFLWPLLVKRIPTAKRIPAPVVVLLLTIPLGSFMGLLHERSYKLQNHEYPLGEQYLVDMPQEIFGMFQHLHLPDFTVLSQAVAWKWVLMFFVIGSLESILSAKAIELLDPWKRKTSMDRDTIAVGLGNALASLIGGLPMISEIVRSKANIDSGARTRFSNFWHGIFLLTCVAIVPMLLHRIPLAALAGMLVYTGFRLAHPQEFVNVYRIGREQLVVFVATMVLVLTTDLLLGVAGGVLIKFLIHMSRGVPLKSMFKPSLALSEIDGQTVSITVGDSAIFSNWIPLKRQIESYGLLEGKNVVLDMSQTKIVDHNVMERLHALQQDFLDQQLELQVIGLEGHLGVTAHHFSTRQRGLASIRRLTITVDPQIEHELLQSLVQLGATGYTCMDCQGMGRHELRSGLGRIAARRRIEIIATQHAVENMLDYLAKEILPKHRITVCADSVDVIRLDAFQQTATDN